MRMRADLGDLRLHDLRHSFASRALALGESLPAIGRLLGHTEVQTTARYAHLAEDSVKAAAARVAASIGEDIFLARMGHGQDVQRPHSEGCTDTPNNTAPKITANSECRNQ